MQLKGAYCSANTRAHMDISENTLLQTLQNDLIDLRDTVRKQQEGLKLLRDDVTALKCKRNEKYYQTFLEGELGGGHKNTKYGVTDITTDVYHVEIKHWCNFKACLGQLQAYNHKDNKKLVAAFFGDTTTSKKLDIIQLFYDSFIDVWELCDFDFGVKIIKHKVESDNDSFKEWLHEHVIYNQDSIVALKDICFSYCQKELYKKDKAKLRMQIEIWISRTFPMVQSKCMESRFNGVKYYGWKGLKLKS
uniref:Uncharacterized protein n=1 Tax=viral metagenome TaxID=1070528 RepID=A0A6C0E0Q1_9ZZZZ